MKTQYVSLLKKSIFSNISKKDIKAIVLFGSRARGDFTSDSDYDVNVYLTRKKKNAWRIRVEGFEEEFQVNIIDKSRFEAMKEEAHPFLYCAFRDGISLYQEGRWFERTRPDILAMRPGKEIVRDYFTRALHTLAFLQHRLHTHYEILHFSLEIEDGKVAANQAGFALMMYHGMYPRSPHTLKRELSALGSRYRKLADTISYLQQAYYTSRETRFSVYKSRINGLYSFTKRFVRKRFPAVYRKARADERVFREILRKVSRRR